MTFNHKNRKDLKKKNQMILQKNVPRVIYYNWGKKKFQYNLVRK